jgi:hypothetical protein
MSNHKNLIFFNKEGDYLNFNYNEEDERFEGDILFHQNSSDTFKTYGLYMMEKIPSFEFEAPDLTLDKFQLFNEYGLHFYGTNNDTQSVTLIEPINNDYDFYSKWIYGEHFESKFPIGTFILFTNPFLEFTDPKKTYVVVGSKKDAIMIISSLDNATFENDYFTVYNGVDKTVYDNVYIRGVNCVGVYDYINSQYENNLSDWSEPNFYDKYYKGRKLNIVNTDKNDSILTVVQDDLTDPIHFEYSTSTTAIPGDSNLIIEVISRTDLPKIYEGPVNIVNGSVFFDDYLNIPGVLKPGREFKVVGSLLNSNFLTVASIPSFLGNTQQVYYATQSQVIYNNKIYQCVEAYTQSFAGVLNFLTPDDSEYWGNPTYLKVNESTSNEQLSFVQVYLTTDKVYFDYSWTQSAIVTLASAASKYKDDLKSFNIDLYYKKGNIKADLMYPSKYAIVNFYHTDIGPTYSIGSIYQTNERLVEVKEKLNYELNYDYSENFKYNLVFTDIDEFGIKVVINKQVYEEEVAWVYSGAAPDMERTIDRTLRAWLTRNYVKLYTLGIVAELSYIGSFTSPFYNGIVLKTYYPNVPFDLTRVEVGTTADYHIEHSRVLFGSSASFGPYLSIDINNRKYDQVTLYGTYSSTQSSYKPTDIPATLEEWVNTHSETLLEYGIVVSSINNLLKFDVKRLDRRLDYTINTNKVQIPGAEDYIITKKVKGNLGCLIASNEVLLSDTSESSFEDSGFATGMIFAINNTNYPYDNQEYNIEFLDPHVLNLSYEGPFWGLTDSICNSSAYVTLAFDLGFGATACYVPDSIVGAGPFNASQFDQVMFALSYNTTEYTQNSLNLSNDLGATNLVDLKYVQLSNYIYLFGDALVVLDAYLYIYVTTIDLTSNTDSIEMEFNTFNNYLYCLSKNILWVIDPLLNIVIKSISLTNNASDMEINPYNGDIYISFSNSPTIDIYDHTNTFIKTLTTPSTLDTMTGKMVFNDFEKDMYVTTDDNKVIRIDGSTRTIQTSYTVPGLTHSIFYEPVNESIYVYGQNLYKIDNGIVYSISSVTNSSFTDVLYNNLTGEMNLSDPGRKFIALDLNTDSLTVNIDVGAYGYMALNQFDASIYMTSQVLNSIFVIDPINGQVIYNQSIGTKATKIIFNPERNSVWAIQPSIKSVVELKPIIKSEINYKSETNVSTIENMYGTLHPDYVKKDNVWLKTREYIRKPRENFNGETSVKYYWEWMTDQTPEFFMYDLSGNQLETIGQYAYTGPKPLLEVPLNKKPNKDITKVNLPEYQQTVFDRIDYTLDYIDDETQISNKPSPLELFLGFKSEEEGAIRTVLQLYKEEAVEFSITSSSTNDTVITLQTLGTASSSDTDKRAIISLNTDSALFFNDRGLKKDQKISINLKDMTNNKNQYISHNNGSLFKIREVYSKSIVLDFLDIENDSLEYETTVISDYPKSSQQTYLKITFRVIDKEIGRFLTYGQTEIEDIRFKTELNNIGKNLGPHEIFIFKDYDILEGGIDWKFLNMKRKEMLLMKNLIYPYIGSYKSIINAINFFGYNDLQLNEYYRNVDDTSPNFLKLFKVEIPDIFDNTVEGWTESDFIKNTMPNEKFEDTNLFNLTYFITDKDGNNILNYSIDDITIKLQGLKHWLRKNIIPLTHKILDITGRSYFSSGTQITHKVNDIRIIDIKQNMTPVTFKLNEAYLMPVNSGSTVYNCVLDFYSIIEGVGADKNPLGLNLPKILPNNEFKNSLVLPDYFDIKIRTYKTYKEWVPFTTYSKGDKVIYYGKVYESFIDSNKIKSPRKYENVVTWDVNSGYDISTIVEYEREYYSYSGLGSTQSTESPLFDQGDNSNWVNITEWKEIDFEPVQVLTEFRKGDNLLPYNFTLDANIDPFVVIEVTSDNGYGSTYRDRKNYEIRTLKDLSQTIQYIESIGPFVPINPIY